MAEQFRGRVIPADPDLVAVLARIIRRIKSEYRAPYRSRAPPSTQSQ